MKLIPRENDFSFFDHINIGDIMKKGITILITFTLLFTLFGCIGSLSPSENVEELLNGYIKNDKKIMIELDKYIDKQELNSEQKDLYKDVIKDEYQNIKYRIKNENIKNKKARVTAEIKVKDLYKIEKESDDYLKKNLKEFTTNGKYNQNKYIFYKLNQLKEKNDTVNYDIKIYMTKKQDVWMINPLSDETIKKIHGMYAHPI